MVLLVSLDYLNPTELMRYFTLLMGFIICMLAALQASSVVHLFLHWELLGFFSYLLINFYSARLNCGIKAVVFNKVGDLALLLIIAWGCVTGGYLGVIFVKPS